MNTTRAERVVRWNRVTAAARAQSGVLHRRQLYALGLTRPQVNAELRARRWRAWGRQTIAAHSGPLDAIALACRAVFETGGDAALDGVSALIAGGLEHFDSEVVHVSVSKSSLHRKPSGVRVHETRRRRTDDVLPRNPPRVKPDVAAIRAALWAKTERQAALILILVAQQGLTTPSALYAAFADIKRDRRRRFIAGVLADIAGGVQSLGELDFARLCRERGIPPPDRQVRRQLPSGRAFVDVYWDRYRLIVEIEGIHHLLPNIAIADSVRQNWLTIDHEVLLRIPVLGLRIAADQFMDQLEVALRDRGWQASMAG